MCPYLFVLEAQQQHLLHQRQARLLRVVVIELLFVLVASHVVVVIGAAAATAVGTAIWVSCVARSHSAHQTVCAIHGVELWGLCGCVSCWWCDCVWSPLCVSVCSTSRALCFCVFVRSLCSVVDGRCFLRQMLSIVVTARTEKNAHTRSHETHPRRQNVKTKTHGRARVRILFDDVVRGCCWCNDGIFTHSANMSDCVGVCAAVRCPTRTQRQIRVYTVLLGPIMTVMITKHTPLCVICLGNRVVGRSFCGGVQHFRLGLFLG